MVGLCGLGKCKGLDEALLSKALALGLLMGEDGAAAADEGAREAPAAEAEAAKDVMTDALGLASKLDSLLLTRSLELLSLDRGRGRSSRSESREELWAWLWSWPLERSG